MNKIVSHKSVLSILLIAFVFVWSGCGTEEPRHNMSYRQKTISNPSPADFLSHPDADIFYFGGVVYSNAEHLDWVKERAYAKTELLGEIVIQTFKADKFADGAANKLPVGTKIYDTDTEIYVAIVDGKEIRYIKMVEG